MRIIQDKRYSVLSIDAVNELARNDPDGLVRSSEEYYNNQVMAAARTICESGGQYKFVLLCGPSASGKTTTAHKLKHRIIALGRGARVLSMDNFFRGMVHYPKLEDGSPNMESVEALDMDLLNGCFDLLMESGKAKFPIFDFEAQASIPEAHDVSLGESDILIMEGIHALNPNVLKHIDRRLVYRIYVSVRTKFVSGEDTVLVPKDIRLMRRMVRDYNFRNYSPLKTLRYWQNVVDSEKINIDTYRDDVERKLDNTIDYEVCVWRELLDGLLNSAELGSLRQYPELIRIFEGLGHFNRVDYKLIPKNSLLREFVGDI
jgi:uridine kinase